MEDLFKKFIYTGVGLVAHTAEKVQQSVNKLIEDNKISAEEGKKIVDDLIKNTQTKKDEFETQLKSISEKVIKGFNYAKKDELDELKGRIEELEKELKKSKAKKEPAHA